MQLNRFSTLLFSAGAAVISATACFPATAAVVYAAPTVVVTQPDYVYAYVTPPPPPPPAPKKEIVVVPAVPVSVTPVPPVVVPAPAYVVAPAVWSRPYWRPLPARVVVLP